MTPHALLAALFWVSAAAVTYTYLGYPVLIWVLARCFGRPREPAVSDGERPTVSMLIAAHDEEAVIGSRIGNALAMNYPPEKLEVVVASDGSTDETAEVARRFANHRVRVLDFAQRRGKSATLNAAFGALRGDLVLLSDANTECDPDAADRIVRWFGDPKVGAVCGRLVLRDPETGRNADGLYWRYETFLKQCEGRLGALLGANGGLYAIRRELLEPIPDQTIVDDFVIPLLAVVRTGCSIVFDPDAVAWEETAPGLAPEFRRRARIGAGGFQSIALLYPLLDPRRGWIAFTFFSHKVLRWTCPLFLVALLVASAALSGRPFYRACLAAQVGFYAASLAVLALPGQRTAPRLLRLAGMFTLMNAALLVGLWRWARRTQGGTWARTPRPVASRDRQDAATE
jgi:cellulose synthase/poly-beta-1,6-N-acetylglucosamine synthase-like glycosyltransferase